MRVSFTELSSTIINAMSISLWKELRQEALTRVINSVIKSLRHNFPKVIREFIAFSSTTSPNSLIHSFLWAIHFQQSFLISTSFHISN
jgi:hypothetical protein